MKKPKLIIVEGADCCGKSTLSREIAKALEAPYWHFTSTKKLAQANTDYMRNGLENARANLDMGRHVVFDRFWPSEHCYGSILRPDQPSAEEASLLYEESHDLDPIYIFTEDSEGMETAVERHSRFQDPDHPYNPLVYAQIYGRYLELQIVMDGRGDQVGNYYFDNERFQSGETGVDKIQLLTILQHFNLH